MLLSGDVGEIAREDRVNAKPCRVEQSLDNHARDSKMLGGVNDPHN